MDNGYVDGLRQLDSRPRSPVIIPHNLSELRKKILFENTLLEERALHEFSAGKGDGAGVDTGSAPLKPLTSPAPAGIPVASTNSITIAGYGTFVKKIGGETITGDGLTIYDGVAYTNLGTNPNAYVLFGPTPTYMGDMSPNQFSEWTLYSVGAYEGGDVNAWLNGTLLASSTSNDIASIPTTGWTPAITITAA